MVTWYFMGFVAGPVCTFSRCSETENSCGMLLCSPDRLSYQSRITTSSQHMWNCLAASPATDRRGGQRDSRLSTGDGWRMTPTCARKYRQWSETTSRRFPQAAAVLMMCRLPLQQPYCRQQNGLCRLECPGCRGGDGVETPRQKQRSAWRWPRDEQSGSGRGLTPRTVSWWELSAEKTHAFTESATMPMKAFLEDTSRVWRRLCAGAIRGGSSSALNPWT